MKIAIITDLHLGYKQYGLREREKDFYRSYHNCIDHIIKERPDVIINAGDTFDIPNPSPEAINEFRIGLEKLKKENIPMISIVGNHTIGGRKDFYQIDYLYEYDYVYSILDERNQHSYIKDDIFIGGVNYYINSSIDELEKKIHDIGEAAKKYKTKILVLHQALEEDFPMGFDIPVGFIPYELFDFVIVGHIHNRMTDNRKNCEIIYPGSLNRCSSVEAIDESQNGKGYVLIDTDSHEWEYVNIEMPREFITHKVQQNVFEDYLKTLGKNLEALNEKPILFLEVSGDNREYVYDLIKEYKVEDLVLKLKLTFNSVDKKTELNSEDIQHGENGLPIISDLIIKSFPDSKEKGKLSLNLYNKLTSTDDKDEIQNGSINICDDFLDDKK